MDPDPNQLYTRRKLSLTKSTSSNCSNEPRVRSVKYPEENWGTSLEKMPLFTKAEMDEHIVNSGKKIANKESTSVPTNLRKAQTFLQDEYLHEIITTSDQRGFYFKAKCSHSFKKSDAPHDLKLAICIISGKVLHAFCSCVAGTVGYCNHILALMLKLCKYTLYDCKSTKDLCKDKDETEGLACTSELQKWHRKGGGSNISPQPISSVIVNKTKCETSSTRTSKDGGVKSLLYEARISAVCHEEKIEQFKQDLSKIYANMGLSQMASDTRQHNMVDTKFGKCPIGSFGSYQLLFTESNFSAKADTSSVPRRIEALNCEQFPRFPHIEEEHMNIPDTLSTEEQQFITSLTKDENEINDIEVNTRAQADCEEWNKQRCHRFTASKFHLISHRKRNHNTLAETLIHPKKFSNRAVEHGRNFEPVALMEYQKYMKNARTPVKVFPSGFVISKSHPILGASPDAKVIDPGCLETFGLAEVKCPYKVANVAPIDACSDPKFCMEKTGTDTCQLKKNHEYYAQVQGQMGVTGCRWCDFILYTRKGIYIQRVAFDADFWNKLRQELTSYYFNNFIKYAIEEASTNNNSEVNENTSNE